MIDKIIRILGFFVIALTLTYLLFDYTGIFQIIVDVISIATGILALYICLTNRE
jgi:hypothetical protein